MSPFIFNRPPIKACVGFSSPLNIFTKSPESMIMVQPASPPGKEPLPALPVIPKITLMLVQQRLNSKIETGVPVAQDIALKRRKVKVSSNEISSPESFLRSRYQTPGSFPSK